MILALFLALTKKCRFWSVSAILLDDACEKQRVKHLDTPEIYVLHKKSYPHSFTQMWVNPADNRWTNTLFAVDNSWIIPPKMWTTQ